MNATTYPIEYPLGNNVTTGFTMRVVNHVNLKVLR